jgi:hypothetical protein
VVIMAFYYVNKDLIWHGFCDLLCSFHPAERGTPQSRVTLVSNVKKMVLQPKPVLCDKL